MKNKINEQIVQLLQQNARRTSQEIAKQLNISAPTVRRRINKLIQDGDIRIVAVPGYQAAGSLTTAVIALDVDNEKVDAVLHSLAGKEEIIWLSSTAGRYDIIALGQFTSTNMLYEFLRVELANVEGLRNSETFICLLTTKGTYIRVPVDI